MNHGSPYPLGATFDGRGVNFARIDGSVGFYASPIRLWPGYYWYPPAPQGDDDRFTLIWQVLQDQ